MGATSTGTPTKATFSPSSRIHLIITLMTAHIRKRFKLIEGDMHNTWLAEAVVMWRHMWGQKSDTPYVMYPPISANMLALQLVSDNSPNLAMMKP